VDKGRRYVLYAPWSCTDCEKVPLWILAPGRGDSAEDVLQISEMVDFAEQHRFAVLVVEGAGDRYTPVGLLNVGPRTEELGWLPDDIAYMRDVLRDVAEKLPIDYARIRCAGYSRGARFCSRLASELSSFVTSVATVSGLRFPGFNNASHPIPVITFHGTEDPINPYDGHGKSYWESSVEETAAEWAKFNGCRHNTWQKLSQNVNMLTYSQCQDNADVVLVKISGAGHTWPGSSYQGHVPAAYLKYFGRTTQEVNANELIFQFFNEHPGQQACMTAVPGQHLQCFGAVTWAMTEGLRLHPEWYEDMGLGSSSTFEDFQRGLRHRFHADCPEPCERIVHA
jgi:polyhydroxybutyrate depolymerase